jgi:hypothetical protein
MSYTIYGFKVPHYIFFNFIHDGCNRYNLLQIDENDSEYIEEHKEFLKLNLRYCIIHYDNDNSEFNYHKVIALDLLHSIEILCIMKKIFESKLQEWVKNSNLLLSNDVFEHIFMKFTTLDFNMINFKSIDIQDENSLNYEIITGICIDNPKTSFYEDSLLLNAKDIVYQLFGKEFKQYKSGIIIVYN